ncbi:hypothetical protein F4801DRAFT_576752 [Xylaria longipes]|nr:hypothetical protein F4801DRAFT_576752 [Xylaria longipes]
MRMQPLPTAWELPDMSTEGEPGQIVTVDVGDKARSFHVHLDKLGPLAKLLDTSNHSFLFIALPKENVDTFNMMINWIYNEPLPRAAKACEYINDTKSTDLTSSTDLTWGNGLSKSKSTKQSEPTKQGGLQIIHAHTTQRMLLDLMMMAERYDWEQLYNAAIDAFREGEGNLERQRPSLGHIKMVYRQTSAGSPVRVFMADYAYSLARVNRNITWYMQEKWFQKFPDFMEDMLKRVDGNGPFKYPYQRFREGKDGEGISGKNYGKEVLTHEAPLDMSATTYHIHSGRMKLDCKRGQTGVLMS